MQTTLFGQKKNSNMQEMGETREPMARDCWVDANRLAEVYDKTLDCDFWVLFAAKPHVQIENGIVAGWEVVAKRPPRPMVGVLVFRWDKQERRLVVEPELCLPPDIPLSEVELSADKRDYVPTIDRAARKSGSIILA